MGYIEIIEKFVKAIFLALYGVFGFCLGLVILFLGLHLHANNIFPFDKKRKGGDANE